MTNNNEKVWRFARLVVPIVLAVLGVVYAYGRTISVKVNTNEKSIIVLTKDIEYIKKGIDRIEGKLK